MKLLTKEWKQELDEYSLILDRLRERGFESLESWRKSLESRAERSIEENRRSSLGAEVDEWVGQIVRSARCEGTFRLDLDEGSISLSEATLSGRAEETIGCELIAAEIERRADGKTELGILFGKDTEGQREYFELTAVGKEISVR